MQQIGKYKVIEELGSGSFGFVYLAEDPKLHVKVAIKVYKIKDVTLTDQVTSAAENAEQVLKQRFIDEARVLRKLSTTPHIVEVYEFDELEDGTPYYVMPFIPSTLVSKIGKDYFSLSALKEIPTTQHPRQLPTVQAIDYLKQLSHALCAVHESGLVHRDVKPANILIAPNNQLQLSDFGIAKLPLTEHSQTHVAMGSKNYMSPEQQESAKHVQASSDIYSLAVIAYRMFTGQLPVGRFQDPISFCPDMPRSLNNLIILALSQSASERPHDGRVFLTALNKALDADHPDKLATHSVINEEDETKVWIAENAPKIKSELKPLESKIIELLAMQGEIKPQDLFLLQSLADMGQLDNLAMQTFINQIIVQQSTKHNTESDNLVGIILWVKTVNKQLKAHDHFLSETQIADLINAGLNSTNKSADQLKVLIDKKQQKTIAKQLKVLTAPYLLLLTKRPILSLCIGLIIVLIFIYGQYQSMHQQAITDDIAWSKAQQKHSIKAYTSYIENGLNEEHITAARQALADLIIQNEQVNKNQDIIYQQQIFSAQKQLIKLGYQIKVTGNLDKRTKRAITDFEEKENLLITGNVDDLLLQKLIQVQQRQDNNHWLDAENKNTIQALQKYQTAFPQGQHIMQATELIRQLSLEQKNSEEQKQQVIIAQRNKMIEQATTQLLNNVITLPSGTLFMGCQLEQQCKDKEKPQRKVSINTFSIMATEVTFSQWDACIASGACTVKPDDGRWGRGNLPVINVNYHDIVTEFIPWLNETTKENFALPSEAQWEYAAKAASTTRYAWGTDIDCSQARYSQFSGQCGNERKTSKVKSYQPNAFGLYDMNGNVWEWTQDCWNDNYLGAPLDGKSWQAGDCDAGVIRGGSWLTEKNLLRSTFRRGYNRLAKANDIGFRLIINPKQ